MSAPFIKTGILQLDTLLFGFNKEEESNGTDEQEDEKLRREKEKLKFAASILIRGGQGAGKTTLALQIVHNQFSPKPGDDKKKDAGLWSNVRRIFKRSSITSDQEPGKVYALFLSLEREAEVALDNARIYLGMKKLCITTGRKCEAGCVLGVSGEKFRARLRKQFERHSAIYWLVRVVWWLVPLALFLSDFLFGTRFRYHWQSCIAIGICWLFQYVITLLSNIHILDTVTERIYLLISRLPKHVDIKDKRLKMEEFHNVIADTLCHFFKKEIRKNKEREHDNEKDCVWIVIDSLNVLERTIFQRTQLEKYRGAMQGLANALHQRLGAKVRVVFTGEYHTPDHDVSGASGESFFCDVEILLSQEPIAGKARTDPRNTAAAGYNIELHHDEKSHPHAANVIQREQRVVETRPFCRVLKSRFGKHQSRRCFYKIEKGKGFSFDESFPGDGDMLLFEDNQKQREDWEIFLLKDGPHEFPALRFELFDRTAQQRIFSTQRSFREHRRDTDLHMASLDTYWLKWFREQNERSVIYRLLNEPQIKWDEEGKRSISMRSEIRVKIEDGLKKQDGMQKGPDNDIVDKETSKRFANVVCDVHMEFLNSQKQIYDFKNSKLKDPASIEIEEKRIREKMLGKIILEIRNVFLKHDTKFHLENLLSECWREFNKCNGMLTPLDWRELRLYGEDCSELLPELASLAYIDKRLHPAKDDEGPERELLSVPFNANVSFMVYLAEESSASIDEDKVKETLSSILHDELTAAKDFWQSLDKEIKAKKSIFELTEKTWEEVAKISFGQIPLNPLKDCEHQPLFQEIRDRIVKVLPPLTWEEVIVRCLLEAKIKKDEKGETKCIPRKFIIETRSLDTLLCTFLEFVWGCGADLSIKCNYKFEKMDWPNLMRLYQAAWLFKRMLKDEIIPQDSTLDSSVFGESYQETGEKGGKEEKEEKWLFMRQWHSTLIDVLVAQRPRKDGTRDYCWKPKPSTKLAIAPLPLSFWQLGRKTFAAEDFENIKEVMDAIAEAKENDAIGNYFKKKLNVVSEMGPDKFIETLNKFVGSGHEDFPNIEDKFRGLQPRKKKHKQIPQELPEQEKALQEEALRKLVEQEDARANRYSKRWLFEKRYEGLVNKRSLGISCWGDWHLAVLQGSENKTLAVELVNNLMSSSKISHRARRGASLPTVTEFYDVFEDSPCVPLTERGAEGIEMPQMTYGELRREIFNCARSRAGIFDYRHCMREFHGFLLAIMHNPKMDDKELGEKLLEVLRRISELRDRELLVH